MAKINGLELKNINEFKGHEGELLYQGNIYLENKKIGEWSQNYMSGPDDIFIESDYDYNKLTAKIIELNYGKEDPFCHEISNTEDYSPWGNLKDYCIELILSDIVILKDWEKEYKKALKKYGPSTGIVIATDGTGMHEYIMPYAGGIDKDTAIEMMKKEDLKFYMNKKAKYMAFSCLDDFNLFEEVKLSDIYSKRYLMKSKQNERQR